MGLKSQHTQHATPTHCHNSCNTLPQHISTVREDIVIIHKELSTNVKLRIFVVPGSAQREKYHFDGLFLLDVDNLTREQVLAVSIDFSGIELGLVLKMTSVQDIYALCPVGSFRSGLEFALKVTIMKHAVSTKLIVIAGVCW